MTRDEVQDAMYRAATLEQIEEARRLMRQWLQLHPDDWNILREAERLAMLESALRELGVQSAGELRKQRA